MATRRTAKKTTAPAEPTTVVEEPITVEVETVQAVDESPNPLLIFSCMDKDMYVWAGEGKKRKLVKLPKAPSPVLLHTPEKPKPVTVIVPKKNGKMHPPTELTTYEEEKTIGIMGEPVVLPHTIYLVDPEDILQFPDRTDFFTPATYELARKKDVAPFLGKEKKKGKKRKNVTGYMFGLNIVASITRTPYGLKTSDTPVFGDDFLTEAMEENS